MNLHFPDQGGGDDDGDDPTPAMFNASRVLFYLIEDKLCDVLTPLWGIRDHCKTPAFRVAWGEEHAQRIEGLIAEFERLNRLDSDAYTGDDFASWGATLRDLFDEAERTCAWFYDGWIPLRDEFPLEREERRKTAQSDRPWSAVDVIWETLGLDFINEAVQSGGCARAALNVVFGREPVKDDAKMFGRHADNAMKWWAELDL